MPDPVNADIAKFALYLLTVVIVGMLGMPPLFYYFGKYVAYWIGPH